MHQSITRVLWAVGAFFIATPSFAASYAFSSGNGSISFHNKASLHEFDGVAQNFSGTLDTVAGTGSMTVQAASLTTKLGPRDSKMHNFCLESSTYGTITFQVSSIGGDTAGLQSGQGSGSVTLNGTLTIRSVPQAVSISANYTHSEGALRLKGAHAMKWGDYGVPDPSILISKLYPDMTVRFNVNMTAQ